MRTREEARIARNPGPGPCAHCGEPATCFGVYEDPSGPVERACDACCGHGNEDGWCESIREAGEAQIAGMPASGSVPIKCPHCPEAIDVSWRPGEATWSHRGAACADFELWKAMFVSEFVRPEARA